MLETFKMQVSLLRSLLIISAIALNCHCNDEEREVYVVYMGEKPEGDVASSSAHHSMLQEVLGSSAVASDSLVYSYGRSFDGFAAKLTDDEVARIKEMEGVVSVIPNTAYRLHTTRSWDFMGMTSDKMSHLPMEGDVIIGVLDTGIWPESPSFSDKDMGPPPAKWKGTCHGANFTCNNKIIGARYYNILGEYGPADTESPRDSAGHGSHTSSTAAGVRVSNASYFGLAEGTAHGAVPRARIAAYKVCWSGAACWPADILAAFDDAIADSVDIVSVSLGGHPKPYFEDAIAIGSYHAMRRGILTVSSAGNDGPVRATVTNNAPWMITVAASTIDRKFIAKAIIGDGHVFIGSSINRFEVEPVIPLVYGGDAPNVSAYKYEDISRFCHSGSLNSIKVEKNLVLCDSVARDVVEAKVAGAIMRDSVRFDEPISVPFPATVVAGEDGASILDYIHSAADPIATVLPGETMFDPMAPAVVSFSSRGPNRVDSGILKPDLTGPGVSILAAWSPLAPPSNSADDHVRVNYNVVSGTSMSCPHVSGAAAYIKSVHPQWSPAAIKSALMTTAMAMDPRKNKHSVFDYGAGHMNPIKALNPGLVFDASEEDYLDYLCSQGYNSTTLKLITGWSVACPGPPITFMDSLNYPSFALAVPDGQPIDGAYRRTVTNVGIANLTYHATAYAPSAFTVKVTPPALSFSSVGETRSFIVTMKGGAIRQQEILSGYIMWRDGTHEVRTPIAVYTVFPGHGRMTGKVSG